MVPLAWVQVRFLLRIPKSTVMGAASTEVAELALLARMKFAVIMG
jgi:hypothetical protein